MCKIVLYTLHMYTAAVDVKEFLVLNQKTKDRKKLEIYVGKVRVRKEPFNFLLNMDV